MSFRLENYDAGTRLRVVQQIPRQSGSHRVVVEGTLIEAQREKTGSWFAHSKDHKLWVDRLKLKKDDGEVVTLNLDHYSVVEAIGADGS